MSADKMKPAMNNLNTFREHFCLHLTLTVKT